MLWRSLDGRSAWRLRRRGQPRKSLSPSARCCCIARCFFLLQALDPFLLLAAIAERPLSADAERRRVHTGDDHRRGSNPPRKKKCRALVPVLAIRLASSCARAFRSGTPREEAMRADIEPVVDRAIRPDQSALAQSSPLFVSFRTSSSRNRNKSLQTTKLRRLKYGLRRSYCFPED